MSGLASGSPALRCVFTVVAAVVAAGCAATAALPVIEEPVTTAGWASLSSNRQLVDCQAADCEVLRDLLASFKALDERDFPNSMARPKRAAPPLAADVLPIVATSRRSAQAAAKACRYLATIARGVDDLSVVLHALEIATQLTPVSADCTHRVAGAAPSMLEGTEVLLQARNSCVARKEPACDQLVRP